MHCMGSGELQLVLCAEVVLFSEVTNALYGKWGITTCPLCRGCPLLRGNKYTVTLTMGSGELQLVWLEVYAT